MIPCRIYKLRIGSRYLNSCSKKGKNAAAKKGKKIHFGFQPPKSVAAKPDIEQEELFRSIHSSEDLFESRDNQNLKADVWQSSIENLP